MRFTLVGAGNLATQLGKALVGKGHEAVQVWSRTAASAQALAEVLGCDGTTDIRALSPDTEVYIVSVKDDALPEMLSLLCKGREDKVFLHTAGSVPMDVFRPYAPHHGVFYPMQTFSKERDCRFEEIHCFVEWSDDRVQKVVCGLAESVCGSVYPLSSERRKRLHLAAVFACNFANHCYAVAEQLLDDAGIGFEVMLPLTDETARKIHSLSPKAAQTGPAIRFDERVMGRHSELLDKHPTWKQIYEVMSRSIHELAKKDKEDNDKL